MNEINFRQLHKMASRRRAAEDKNTKLLRELASIPANKQCFDCLQRGPTYINVTIGSFVCTKCSGILRGLTPPLRVKSISMTTFTPEEIEFLKSRGNEYCKYVWLGTFDTSTNTIESEVSDDQRRKDFLVQKYEKKRWYVDPDVAVRKLQNDINLRQKQGGGVPQSQSFGTRSNVVAETQPLTRLLGKSPTPLLVHNNQNTESWPHPVSSASAPTISTKTSSQNNGSRSIDLLSELASNTSISAAQGSMSSSSTANGNFANFENAFNSVEKSVTPPPPPPTTNLPSSTSLDAYPLQSRQHPTSVFNPPTNQSTTKQHNNNMDQDRYAALADLDSLFHQPNATKAPSWTVETTSSGGSLFDTTPAVKSVTTFSSASSNPFASSDLWSQPLSTAKQSFQSANPFHNTSVNDSLTYSQTAAISNHPFAPFQIPMVGNSPSEDNIRSQFNANFSTSFPAQMVMSPTNGYGGGLFQNDGVVSPTSGMGAWNLPTSTPIWTSSSQMGLGGLFTNENKSDDYVQQPEWTQSSVNPFMTPSPNAGFPGGPKSNSSNPFL